MHKLNVNNYYEEYKIYYSYKCKNKNLNKNIVHLLLKEYKIRYDFFKIPIIKLNTIILKIFKQLDSTRS